MIISGHEDKSKYGTMLEEELQRKNMFVWEGVLHRILTEIKSPNPRIELITTPSLTPKEIGQMQEAAFSNLQVLKIGIVDIASEEEGNDLEVLERLRKAKFSNLKIPIFIKSLFKNTPRKI